MSASKWTRLLAVAIVAAACSLAPQVAAVGPGPGVASTTFRPEYCRTTSPETHLLEGAVMQMVRLGLSVTLHNASPTLPTRSYLLTSRALPCFT